MADELDNWDDDSWFNFNNEENEEEFKGKEEVGKVVVGETSKSAAGNGTNGDRVKKVQEAAALMPPPPPRPPVVKGKGKKRAADAGTSGGGNGGVPESADHELHIVTERERRKKMKDMFTNLHALLTHLQPKADKATIVSEAAEFIKKLQEAIQTLEQQKLERLYQFAAAVNNNPLLNNPFINYNPFSFITTTPNLPPTQSREAFLAELGSSSGNNNNNNTAAIALPNQAEVNNIAAFPVVFKTWTSSNVTLSVLGKDAHFSVCCVKKGGLLSSIGYVIEKYKMEVITAQVSSDNNQSIFMIHARMDVASSEQFAEVEEIYKEAAAEIMFWVTS